MSTPVANEVHAGATPNERLIAAARDDNQELLLEVFDNGGFDINHKGLFGNTGVCVNPILRSIVSSDARSTNDFHFLDQLFIMQLNTDPPTA